MGSDGNLELVEKPAPDQLLSDARAANHTDILVARRFLFPFERAFKTVSDESELQFFVLSFRYLLRDCMSEHEFGT